MDKEEEQAKFKKEFEELANNKFKQQKLPAWRPVPTITSTTITFVSFGVVFIIIGAIILSYSNKIVEVSSSYHTCSTTVGTTCNVTFTVEKEMTAPVMIYYQLNNFYQNHRRYVKSKSSDQLQGKLVTLSEVESSGDCSPAATNAEMGRLFSVNGTPLNQSEIANPCGLIAKSLFNDTYTLQDSSGNNIFINDTDISWEADRDMKYKHPEDPEGKDPNYWQKVQWTNVTNEHFIVWMRPAGLPNFRKLWGRVQQTLQPGSYYMIIENNFPVAEFQGEKFFVLSTVNSFGGKNNFLGISYIVVGCICIVLAIAFVIGYKIHNAKQRKDI